MGYPGRFKNGIRLCSKLGDVLAQSGGALGRYRVKRGNVAAHGKIRVLYEVVAGGEVTGYLFRDTCHGVRYWFGADKRLRQIVVSGKSKHPLCYKP